MLTMAADYTATMFSFNLLNREAAAERFRGRSEGRGCKFFGSLQLDTNELDRVKAVKE